MTVLLSLSSATVLTPGPLAAVLPTFSECEEAGAVVSGIGCRSPCSALSAELDLGPCWGCSWCCATCTCYFVECLTLVTHEVALAVADLPVPFLVAATPH